MATRPNVILGISTGHGDSSAALIVDGLLVAAAEEERFTRVKHYALFPSLAAAYCLRQAGLEPHDVQAIVVAKKPTSQILRRMAMAWTHPHLVRERMANKKNSDRQSFAQQLKLGGYRKAKVIRVEHHHAHMMSVRMMTATESISLMTIDGLGDFVSATIGRAKGSGVEILQRQTFPHSLGYFYTAMTQYLGFPHFGDEFKVMGLSSYGEPYYLKAMQKLIREDMTFGFRLNLEAFPLLERPISIGIQQGRPKVTFQYNQNLLTQIIGVGPRKPSDPITDAHSNLAKSIQARFEEVANHMLRQLHEKIPTSTVGLAGGCAHNSVWVGKIPTVTPFQKVLVAPASHDAGLAVGAAAIVAETPIQPESHHWALLGPEPEGTTKDIRFPFEVSEKTFKSEEALIDWMVTQLAQKKIIGLCNGRMEFGPRALGSRSLLADPRFADMKELINEKVKHRENFRPFAASVQWEHQDKWFHNAFFSPSMEAVFEVKQPSRIPAVTHVDNTCRIQSVTRENQPFFWALLEQFRKKTGVPMLLNTSFNDQEPIVCSEEHAMKCFAQSDFDCLVIGLRTYDRIRESAALAG